MNLRTAPKKKLIEKIEAQMRKGFLLWTIGTIAPATVPFKAYLIQFSLKLGRRKATRTPRTNGAT